MENVSQLSNFTARLKIPPKLPSSHKNSTRVILHEAKRSSITNHTQATGKTTKAEQTPSYAHKTTKLTVSHPHRMTHSSWISTPPLDTVGVGWSTRIYAKHISHASCAAHHLGGHCEGRGNCCERERRGHAA